MPTYQYECGACGHAFDVRQSISEGKLRKCPQCGKFKLHRLIGTGGGIIFKGSGFYETDYKRKAVSCDSKAAPSKPAACPAKDGAQGCPSCPAAPKTD